MLCRLREIKHDKFHDIYLFFRRIHHENENIYSRSYFFLNTYEINGGNEKGGKRAAIGKMNGRKKLSAGFYVQQSSVDTMEFQVYSFHASVREDLSLSRVILCVLRHHEPM